MYKIVWELMRWSIIILCNMLLAPFWFIETIRNGIAMLRHRDERV